MSKTRVGMWFAAPLLALVAALACAPAAFGLTTEALQAAALEVQEGEATGEEETPAMTVEEEYYSFGIGADLDRASLAFTDSASQVYTGKAITPKFAVTLDGKQLKGTTNPEDTSADYYYFYIDNVAVGKGQLYLVTFDTNGIPHTKTGTFTIKQAPISKAKFKVPSQVYTGKKLKPAVNVKFNGMTLKQGTDYKLKYSKNVKVGKGKVTITGKGQFKGKKTVTFKIKKASIANAKFSTVKPKTYTGKAIKPGVTVKFKGKKLKQSKDYTITYSKNTNAGVAKMKVKGKGNMKGSHTIEFVINPRPISKAKLEMGKAVWTGGNVVPDLKLTDQGKTLMSGKDYTVFLSNNTDVGEAKARISAWGNYSGSYTTKFAIEARPITDKSVSINFENPTTHKVVKDPLYLSGSHPFPTITYNNGSNTRSLRYGSEYELAWKESADGKGTVTITGIDHFTGTTTLPYRVKKSVA